MSVFAYASEAGKQRAYGKLPARMTSLRQELGREVTAEDVQENLVRSFEEVLRIDLAKGGLSEVEETAARRLADEKYGSAVWTRKI